jgi:Tol biopolymer transport system component/DNA-binding winged helix-turn-helix (wHTH) protein
MSASSSKIYEFGEWRLDATEHLLLRKGSPVSLSPKLFDTLLVLVENAGRLVTKEEFMKRVWPDTFVEDLALTQNISQLRKVLGSAESSVIETVPKRGYRLLVPVQVQGIGSAHAGDQPAAEVRPSRFVGRISRKVTYLLAAALALLVILILTIHGPGLRASHFVQITSDGYAKQGPLVADGLRLYFSEGSPNHRVLAQVSESGGETSLLSNSLENPDLLDISPNRSELLVASSGGTTEPSIWSLPLPTGAPHRTGNVLANDAAWSPDGQDMAYVNGHDLYRARSDGSGATRLVALPGTGSWPRWSPDGTRLRVTVTNETSSLSSIWEVSAVGKVLHPILPGWNQPAGECCGNWTPDGRYFVFQSTRGGRTEIWGIPERQGFLRFSGRPVQLTFGQMNSLSPVVSSNGKKLYVMGQQLRGELVRYDPQPNQFVPYLSGISAEFIDFSQDGKWVAYVAFPEHTLWRSKVDGSERLQLTLPPMQATVPRWSPDGRRIAFFDAAPGKPWRIYLVPSDGGTPQQVLDEQHNEMDPNWSPDGNSLLFSYFPIFETEAPESLGVYIVDLKTRITTTLPGSKGFWAPRWSKDGRYVVARSLDSETLMLFDFKTQSWRELAKGVYFGFTDWSGDGQDVYYLRRGPEPAVLRVRIADGKTKEVASLKDLRQTGFRGGIWMGLSPENLPLVLRDVGTQEIYSLDLETR